MSGSAGHIAHPYECLHFTFEDFKNIFRLIDNDDIIVREKFDGQNLQITWKNNQVLAARRKSQLKNKGKKALPYTEIHEHMFGDSTPDAIVETFYKAVKDLDRAFKIANSIEPNLLDSVFKDGANFLNVEVIHRDTENVIPYANSENIVFHNLHEYKENGDLIDNFNYNVSFLKAGKLYTSLKKHDCVDQKNFDIHPPIELDLDTDHVRVQDYINSIDSIRKNANLENDTTLGEHLEQIFYLYLNQMDENGHLTKKQIDGLINRWVYEDKSYNLNTFKSDLKGKPELRDNIILFERNSVDVIKNDCISPFEKIFLNFGTELFVVNNSEFFGQRDINHYISNVKTGISEIKAADKENVQRYLKEIDKFKKLLPDRFDFENDDLKDLKHYFPFIEGVVFNYKNQLVKLTGLFAPLNQVIGYLRFN